MKLCLDNCEYVAAICPASFFQSGLFRHRLHHYILLHDKIFVDTENPVCLALFGKEREQTDIYYDAKYIGEASSLKKYMPSKVDGISIRFNDPTGRLGFISFDNTQAPTIRFCDAREIADYEIKVSSRFITRIDGDFGSLSPLIKRLNNAIDDFRQNTKDVFLTPFKGLRKDGKYRRRMDFDLARRFIGSYMKRKPS